MCSPRQVNKFYFTLDGSGDILNGRWSNNFFLLESSARSGHGRHPRAEPELEEVSASGVWDICVEGERPPQSRAPA